VTNILTYLLTYLLTLSGKVSRTHAGEFALTEVEDGGHNASAIRPPFDDL